MSDMCVEGMVKGWRGVAQGLIFLHDKVRRVCWKWLSEEDFGRHCFLSPPPYHDLPSTYHDLLSCCRPSCPTTVCAVSVCIHVSTLASGRLEALRQQLSTARLTIRYVEIQNTIGRLMVPVICEMFIFYFTVH